MVKPNFFIVGAPKCGTTSLYEYLKGHPNIFLPQLKEPHFFAEDMRERRSFYTKTAEEYFALFADATDDHTAIGEASVFYLYSSKALEAIRLFNDNGKIIVMLRNPVDMIVSLHSQMVYSSTETRIDFELAWRENNLPERRPSPAIETYEQAGKFGVCIERLFSIFPKYQVKIILLEDLRKSARNVYEDVLRFLGTPSDHRNYFPIINENKKMRMRTIGKLTQNPPKLLWLLYRSANNITGKRLHELVKNVMRVNEAVVKRQTIRPELRQEMIREFSEDIDKLSSLIHRDLSHWKSLAGYGRG